MAAARAKDGDAVPDGDSELVLSSLEEGARPGMDTGIPCADAGVGIDTGIPDGVGEPLWPAWKRPNAPTEPLASPLLIASAAPGTPGAGTPTLGAPEAGTPGAGTRGRGRGHLGLGREHLGHLGDWG